MADEKTNLVLDLTGLSSFLVDLPPGGLVGLRPEKDDLHEVMVELTTNQATSGDLAGITVEDLSELGTHGTQISQVDEKLATALKYVEMLQETRAKIVDARERKISNIGKRIKLNADDKKAPQLLATYENTLKYPSQIAEKAAKTRKKNEAAKEETPAEK